MNKQDKEYLANKQLSNTLLIACLATCEKVIGKNAYMEKKWASQPSSDTYRTERKKWMEYREKIRLLLKNKYPMKEIIRMTKGCTDRSTQKEVMQVIDLINRNDYVLVADSRQSLAKNASD